MILARPRIRGLNPDENPPGNIHLKNAACNSPTRYSVEGVCIGRGELELASVNSSTLYLTPGLEYTPRRKITLAESGR
jgi:hypothetical protein